MNLKTKFIYIQGLIILFILYSKYIFEMSHFKNYYMLKIYSYNLSNNNASNTVAQQDI